MEKNLKISKLNKLYLSMRLTLFVLHYALYAIVYALSVQPLICKKARTSKFSTGSINNNNNRGIFDIVTPGKQTYITGGIK